MYVPQHFFRQRRIPSDVNEAIEHRWAAPLPTPGHYSQSVSGDIGATLAEEFKRLSSRCHSMFGLCRVYERKMSHSYISSDAPTLICARQ